MQKIFFIFMISILPLNVQAKAPTDVEQMGALAGAVMACGGNKSLYAFEEILSRYYSNTARNQMEEENLFRTYAINKAKSYQLQIKKSKRECPATLSDFTKMDIFKSQLYTDGTVKTPGGKFLYPRGQRQIAPNATLISIF